MASSERSPMKSSLGNGAPFLRSVGPRGDASELTKPHRVILLFYPLDFTFVVSDIPRFCHKHKFLADYFFFGLRLCSAVPHRARSIR
jgi:hypothetical protein